MSGSRKRVRTTAESRASAAASTSTSSTSSSVPPPPIDDDDDDPFQPMPSFLRKNTAKTSTTIAAKRKPSPVPQQEQQSSSSTSIPSKATSSSSKTGALPISEPPSLQQEPPDPSPVPTFFVDLEAEQDTDPDVAGTNLDIRDNNTHQVDLTASSSNLELDIQAEGGFLHDDEDVFASSSLSTNAITSKKRPLDEDDVDNHDIRPSTPSRDSKSVSEQKPLSAKKALNPFTVSLLATLTSPMTSSRPLSKGKERDNGTSSGNDASFKNASNHDSNNVNAEETSNKEDSVNTKSVVEVGVAKKRSRKLIAEGPEEDLEWDAMMAGTTVEAFKREKDIAAQRARAKALGITNEIVSDDFMEDVREVSKQGKGKERAAEVHVVDDLEDLDDEARGRDEFSNDVDGGTGGVGKKRFSVRNVYYLTVAPNRVLQLVLFMKAEFTSWFTEELFEHVLAALKPLVINKFKREEVAKEKGLADVYRCPSFRFAYYVKPLDIRHTVLCKDETTRTYEGKIVHGQSLIVAVEPNPRAGSPKRSGMLTKWVGAQSGPFVPPKFPGVRYGKDMKVD
ncbi:hypothetical protein HDU76_012811 [Blyttiomyces sp. JEL0837]|nr:hypothetical protein HDU76_012811 [Blyttiomyces sp. JEL0837]